MTFWNFRADMRAQMRRFARQYAKKKLRFEGYPDFCLRAWADLHPEWQDMSDEEMNDPDVNFSHAEATDGWIAALPRVMRVGDLQTAVDQFNRPDKYAEGHTNYELHKWNYAIEHQFRRIKKIYVKVQVPKPTRKNPIAKRTINYHWLRPVRGKEFIRQAVAHLNRMQQGIDEETERLNLGLKIKTIDEAIEERLRWQENGGNP